MKSSRSPDTPQRILDVAERLVQTRGYNGFSYADVAAELSITKASLHYHFASKAELGRALVGRYRERFVGALASIDEEGLSPNEKLARYAELYAAVLREDRMCLCGMMAAEYATLPKSVQGELRRFFSDNEAWLANVLAEGARVGTTRVCGTPLECARLVVSTLEGAMLLARSCGSVSSFEVTARRLVDELCAAPALPARTATRAGRRSTRLAAVR
jgi:TetR/AcrR family transcriptional repressor of nem operon